MSSVEAGLFDTSAVIDFDDLPSEHRPGEILISAVTLAELSAGTHATRDPRERGRRQRQLQFVESTFEPLPFDAAAAREYSALWAAAAAAGRTGLRRRALDFMIAATARAAGLPLYTRNPSDFEGLEELVEIVAVR